MKVGTGIQTVIAPFLSKLITRLQAARHQTDAFFDLMTADALYIRPLPERHRLIFYVGHLEAFDWNLLATRILCCPSLHQEYERLFAFGIDPVDGQLPCDEPADWPTLLELLQYRQRVRSALDEELSTQLLRNTAHDLVAASALGHTLQMLIEHRLMHLETLAYMLPHLPVHSFVPERVFQKEPASACFVPGYARAGAPHQVRVIEIPSGSTQLGQKRSAAFGWDNEFEPSTVSVPGFAVDARNVTNEEFCAFVEAGGYSDSSLWSDADWSFVRTLNLLHPQAWRCDERGGYFLRTAFREIPLPLDWPAMVSLAEARAYTRYKTRQSGMSCRLLSETEYHRAAYGQPGRESDACENAERFYPWGNVDPVPLLHGNFGCQRYESVPVAAFSAGDSAFAVTDLVGNGWEWTGTPFAPFAGFVRNALYPGYSQPFFDNQHFVLKGASARTDTIFLRPSFRNWFQPHYPYVFATFRCAYDLGKRC